MSKRLTFGASRSFELPLLRLKNNTATSAATARRAIAADTAMPLTAPVLSPPSPSPWLPTTDVLRVSDSVSELPGPGADTGRDSPGAARGGDLSLAASASYTPLLKHPASRHDVQGLQCMCMCLAVATLKQQTFHFTSQCDAPQSSLLHQ